MAISRRNLFGLGAGAAAASLLPQAASAASYPMLEALSTPMPMDLADVDRLIHFAVTSIRDVTGVNAELLNA